VTDDVLATVEELRAVVADLRELVETSVRTPLTLAFVQSLPNDQSWRLPLPLSHSGIPEVQLHGSRVGNDLTLELRSVVAGTVWRETFRGA
jgi:hypothetical protein